ncbi:hypothetical protein BSKO_03744 [Bryopsis sp. KO-2023]|nr:hypothetical protein BSKO_03744 [Bryopsis sp. KO-2023]
MNRQGPLSFFLVEVLGLVLLCCGTVSGANRFLLQETQCCTVTFENSFGRLGARPSSGDKQEDVARGLQPLGLTSGEKDGWVFVPDGYSKDSPAALLLLLHGARKTAKEGLESDFKKLREVANQKGVILVAPDSRAESWDRIRFGEFGTDVAYIDVALGKAFDQYAVDSSHIGIAGFSDGATYALSLGLTNGDLFTHIIAFSPGGLSPSRPVGRPKVFDAHGISDDILPIDATSRRIVPLLRNNGYDVTAVEFDAKHWIPEDIAQQAMDWFV